MKAAILLASLLLPAGALATPTGQFVARLQAASQAAKPAGSAVTAEVQTLPAAWQSREFAESFGAVMDRRHPCAGRSPRG